MNLQIGSQEEALQRYQTAVAAKETLEAVVIARMDADPEFSDDLPSDCKSIEICIVISDDHNPTHCLTEAILYAEDGTIIGDKDLDTFLLLDRSLPNHIDPAVKSELHREVFHLTNLEPESVERVLRWEI
ncbi:MAG: hypothetical protein JJU20_10245 [Opitutales bacterium]|nr:hypothetical protein [Opitutales bacterium]